MLPRFAPTTGVGSPAVQAYAARAGQSVDHFLDQQDTITPELAGHAFVELVHADPATIAPAMRRNIPVWVLNSRNPEGKGTEIVAHPGDECSIKAITAKKGVTVVDVEAVRWLAPEILRA